MGLLDRLFGRTASASQDAPRDAALLRAVELIEPRLALARDWKSRLAPGVEAAISCAREVAGRLKPPQVLSKAAWSDSPVLRAAFPKPQAVDETLRGAREVHRFFRQHDNASVCAVLGVQFKRVRQFDRVEVEGRVIEDVQVERVSFSAHQLKVVAADPEALRQATGARVFNDLMLAAARRLAEAASRGKELSVVRAMLQARLRMLERDEGCLFSEESGVTTDAAVDLQAQRTEIELQLSRLSDSIADTGTGADALDRQLDIARDTLLRAREILRIQRQQIRLDEMNRVLPYVDPRGQLVEFDVAQGAGVDRAFVAVCIRRQDVPDGGLRISAVERTL